MPAPKSRQQEVRTKAEIVRDHRRAGGSEKDAKCIRDCLATVRMMMELGWDDATMCVEFGVSDSELAQYKSAILARERANLEHRPVLELFIEYKLIAMSDAMALEDIASKARLAGEYNAAIAARKARFTIVDKVMDRGQELGLIPRAAKRTEVVGGMLIAQLSDTELLEAVRDTAEQTRELVARYGGSAIKPFTALPAPDKADLYRDDIPAKDDERKPKIKRTKAR